MKIADFPSLKACIDDLGPKRTESGFVQQYDFYRCYKCDRIITRDEEKGAYSMANSGKTDRVSICPCGSMKFSATWPVTTWSVLPWQCDSEWLRVNVIRYTLKLALARGVAPWCERHFSAALPWIEWVIRKREA